MSRIPKKNFFAIIFEKRTGSSFVSSSLNSCSDILCYPEILANENTERQFELLDLLVKGEELEKTTRYAEDPKYFHGPLSEKVDLEFVGLKVSLVDVQDVGRLFRFFQANDFRLIYLNRRNIFQSVASQFNTKRLQRRFAASNIAREDQIIKEPFRIDPKRFIQAVDERVKNEWVHRIFFEDYPGPKLMLRYEEIGEDPSAFFSKLFRLLEMAPRETKSTFLKSMPLDPHEIIENYDEILAAMKTHRPKVYYFFFQS